MEVKFLRIGKWWPDEKSHIYRSGNIIGTERGVSVFEILLSDSGDIQFLIPVSPSAASTLEIVMNFTDKYTPKYIVEGDIVGRGIDREPLLKNIKIVRDITQQFNDTLLLEQCEYDQQFQTHCATEYTGPSTAQEKLELLLKSKLKIK